MLYQTLQTLVIAPIVLIASAYAFATRKHYNVYTSVLVLAALHHLFGGYTGTPVHSLLFGQVSNEPRTLYVIVYGAATLIGYAALVKAITRAFNWNGEKRQISASETNSESGLTRHTEGRPRYTFADVDGMSELKTSLMSSAEDIVAGKKNGILFFGEPGNGKTFIAEAFAGEIAKLIGQKKPIGFLSVTMGDLASRWINQGTEQIKDLFAQAAAAAARNGALVLFIDEIDAVLPERSGIADQNSEKVQIVNSMLALLVQYRNFKQHRIIIVGATNFYDRLDKAAIREGRFDFKQEIKAPDTAARIGLLMSASKGATLPKTVVERAAYRWEGFGVARLRHVAGLAAKNVLNAGRTEITFDDLMAALREAQGCKGVNLPDDTPSLDQLSFDDGLADRLKQLARRMTEIDRIEAMGGTVPKGVLFYGPPGTGKTAVAKALAVSSGWAFIQTSGQKIMADPNEFGDVVTKASDLRPAIVFIDEADDILADRASNPYGKSATNNLLAIMDGERPLRDVMFVAATNHAEAMDAAALRGGRFAEHFYFAPPSDDTLVTILAAFIDSKPQAPWSDDFTAVAAATMLRRFDPEIAPATAKDRIQQAINRAVTRLDGSRITLADLAAVL